MNKRICLALTVLPLALSSPQAAAGEEVEIPPELGDYISLPAHNLTTGGLAGQQAAQLPPCKSDTARLSAVSVLTSVKFDGARRKPVEGIWKEAWQVDGCDISGVFNVLVIVGHGRLHLTPLAPGQSLANPLEQQSAAAHAITAAVRLAADPGCKRSRIIDTRFVDFEGDAPAGAETDDRSAGERTDGAPAAAPRPARPWREEWTVDFCGARVIAPVHFTPGALNAAARSLPEEARRKE